MSNVNIVNGDCGDHVCKADKKKLNIFLVICLTFIYFVFFEFLFTDVVSLHVTILSERKKKQTLSWFLTINCVCVLKYVSLFISSAGLEN